MNNNLVNNSRKHNFLEAHEGEIVGIVDCNLQEEINTFDFTIFNILIYELSTNNECLKIGYPNRDMSKFLPNLSVYQNIYRLSDTKKAWITKSHSKLIEICDILNIRDLLDCSLLDLSNDQLALCSVASVLLKEPNVIWLNTYEFKSEKKLKEIICAINQYFGINVFFFAKDLKMVEDICDRAIFIHSKEVILNSKVSELKPLLCIKELTLTFKNPTKNILDNLKLDTIGITDIQKSYTKENITICFLCAVKNINKAVSNLLSLPLINIKISARPQSTLINDILNFKSNFTPTT